MPDRSGLVLVVDDDEDWVDALSDFLAEEGYSVVRAPDGQAALEQLSRVRPFAVVTDIQMPIMDGWQLLARIHDRDAHVPVIVVASPQPPRDGASPEAAFRVMRKPVRVEDLLSALEAARAHRAAHLPLQKLWGAARARRIKNVSRPRLALRRLGSSFLSWPAASHVALAAIIVASSFAFLRHWRGGLS